MKTYLKAILPIFVAVLLLYPSVSSAANIKGGNDISVHDEVIQGNLYIGSSTANVSSKIEGDLVIGAGEIVISGEVMGDITIIGGNVSILNNVQGDVRVIGGNVLISGSVNGELLVIGGEVKINETVKLNSDTIIIAGKVDMSGEASRYLKIIASQVILNNTFSGGANVTTQALSFGDKANITGSVAYFAPSKAIESGSAQLTGNINFNQVNTIRESGIAQKLVLSFISFWILLKFITSLLLAFILVFVFRVFSQRVADYGIERIGKSALIGFLVAILIPIIIVLLLVSLVAMPIAILLLLAYTFFFIIAFAISGIILGALLKRTFTKNKSVEISFNSAAIGIVVLTIIPFVPVIGDLTKLFFFLISFGAVSHYIYHNIRWRKPNLLESKNK